MPAAWRRPGSRARSARASRAACSRRRPRPPAARFRKYPGRPAPRRPVRGSRTRRQALRQRRHVKPGQRVHQQLPGHCGHSSPKQLNGRLRWPPTFAAAARTTVRSLGRLGPPDRPAHRHVDSGPSARTRAPPDSRRSAPTSPHDRGASVTVRYPAARFPAAPDNRRMHLPAAAIPTRRPMARARRLAQGRVRRAASRPRPALHGIAGGPRR